MSARIFVETLRSPTIGMRDNKVWPAPLHCHQINQSSQFLEANDQDIASLVSSFSQLNIESTLSQSPSPSPASTHALSTPAPSPSAKQTPTSTSTSSPQTPQTATRVNHLVTCQLRYIRNIEKLAEDLWKSLPISGNISLSVLSDVEAHCSQLVTDLDKLKHTDPEVKRRRLAVADKLHNVEARAMDLRNAHMGGALGPTVVCTDRQYNHPIEKLDNIAQMSILIGLVCSLFMGTSRRAGDFIMKSLSLLVATVYEAAGRSPPQTVLNQIPATITHALAQLNIESHTTIYAVCPRCCFTHHPKYHHNSTIATYLSTCTHKETSESDVCGEPLLTGHVNSGLSKPIKPFVYHHFSDYMAGLLSSEKDEESMDRACDDAFASVHEPPPEQISNIFQGSFLRSFLGPDGKLFIDHGTEGRYVHSLNIDFFDAEGLTVWGASASWGLFSSACLNLSDSEMFKPEKMYVNIIPGPHKPNVDQLNHFIRPFVDEMRASWEQGVYYTHTALHPEGRMARDAVANALTIPFVLDSSPYPNFLYRLSLGDEGKLFIWPDGLAARLDNYKLPALCFATYCVLRTMEVPKSKPECISLMLDWRMRQILAPDLSLFEKRLSTPETMAHIQSVIKNTAMPSWFDKPPQAFGEAAMGKLQADEWQSVSSIYLPLALVSLWGEGSQMDLHPDREYYWQVLNLSMLLASAMFLVSRCTTTMQTAEVYR
ncbi:hypothetical protein BDN71DRAFT_1512883 [Pleurotus eryngii]|uniref:Uncharacterized protein n=1 Tax=Pleurotus eryngii TaxID=5323 RepID=A0A9P5ZLR2_PLEER|nr:hypothetical protein BDN71DRAFT_1512883 [Pleurotus eryngii]